MRPCFSAALCVVASLTISGCGSSAPAVEQTGPSVKHEVARGVAYIRATHDLKTLHAQLGGVLARLRRARPATAGERRGKDLALRGFAAMRRGVRSRLDFFENDSGNPPNATRDAGNADRFMTRGAIRLRAAGQALGIAIGKLEGF